MLVARIEILYNGKVDSYILKEFASEEDMYFFLRSNLGHPFLSYELKGFGTKPLT